MPCGLLVSFGDILRFLRNDAYNGEMIVVAPQLSDWGETSANQTIALVEYFLKPDTPLQTAHSKAIIIKWRYGNEHP